MMGKASIGVKIDHDGLRTILAPIAHLRLFCVFKVKDRAGAPGKLDKIPCVCGASGMELLTGSYDKSDLANRLLTLEEAIAVVNQRGGQFVGVGLVITKGCGIVGVDFDDCIDPATGKLKLTTAQRRAVNLLKRYAAIEKSVSGLGLHFLVLGDCGNAKVSGELEVFGSAGFIALTGTNGMGVISEAPPEVIAAVLELVAGLKAEKRRQTNGAAVAPKRAYADADYYNDEALGRTDHPPPTVEMVREMLTYIPAAV